jgi:hypothetical protein
VLPFPATTTFSAAWSLVNLRPRCFREDAQTGLGRMPPLMVLGESNIPAQGGCLLVFNHYAAPGFRAWWIALAISALVPLDIHWVMTAAWSFENHPFARPMKALSYKLFQRVAQIYGFTAMPSMPPDPSEVERRAAAVRHALAYARCTPQPVIGLSPEGQDHPGGCLGVPPPGVGRFVALLALSCPRVHPIGVYLQDGQLRLNFGLPYHLDLSPRPDDALISRGLMLSIANLLPPELRGANAAQTRFYP